MKLLEERILQEGMVIGEDILKVDGFINHQVDIELMEALGRDMAEHFEGQGITKVFTIESSGIAPALFTAKYLNVPMVILKKQISQNLQTEVWQTEVASYTKNVSYELTYRVRPGIHPIISKWTGHILKSISIEIKTLNEGYTCRYARRRVRPKRTFIKRYLYNM